MTHKTEQQSMKRQETESEKREPKPRSSGHSKTDTLPSRMSLDKVLPMYVSVVTEPCGKIKSKSCLNFNSRN